VVILAGLRGSILYSLPGFDVQAFGLTPLAPFS
jgi:hypothetical protein